MMVETSTLGHFHHQRLDLRRWVPAFFTSHKTLLTLLWIAAFASVFLWQRNIVGGFLVYGGIPGRPMPMLRPMAFNLTDFGGVGDGVTLNTEAFERAVSAVSKFGKKGGAQLNVPPGRWLTAPFNLTSHMTLFLAEDAVILGIDDAVVLSLVTILRLSGKMVHFPFMICDGVIEIKVPLKLKGKFYNTTIRSVMLYGTECWIVKSQQEIKCRKDDFCRENDRERNYAGKGYQRPTATIVAARLGEGRQKNWRDAPDVYSFYFTRFPEDVGEKELWFEFKKWGDLGNLIIGGLKMHANLPKHGRVGKPIEKFHKEDQYKQGLQGDMQVDRVNERVRAITAQTPAKGGKQQNCTQQQTLSVSYATPVTMGSKTIEKRWSPTAIQAMKKPSQSSIRLTISMEERKWFSSAWVGRLRNLLMFDRLEEEFLWDGGEDIWPKYLGDDMVLLLGLSDEKAEKRWDYEYNH
ncbi:putative polygalacturonase [Glycine max]|nr:putative polygalacturonase [Glycine max]